MPPLSYVNLRIYIRRESGKNGMVVIILWRLSYRMKDVAHDHHPVHGLFRMIEPRWHSMTFPSTCVCVSSNYPFFFHLEYRTRYHDFLVHLFVNNLHKVIYLSLDRLPNFCNSLYNFLVRKNNYNYLILKYAMYINSFPVEGSYCGAFMLSRWLIAFNTPPTVNYHLRQLHRCGDIYRRLKYRAIAQIRSRLLNDICYCLIFYQ